MHFHQICKLHILIYGGHAREEHGFKLCCCFSLPVDVCIDVTFILAYVTIGSYISCVSTNYTFATVYKGRHTKEMSVIDKCRLSMSLRMLPSGCNYLKRVLSQHLTNNFECLHKVHFSKCLF